MDLKNHCLFCLERTVPYSVSSIIKKSISTEGSEDVIPPDFQTLCTYLGISLSEKGKEYEGLVLSSSCDKFLCISCFQMVDHLSKLRMELTEIQRRIREVIVAHDISANLSSGNKERREAFEKKVGAMASRRMRRRKDVDCLGFLEMFQTMIKSLNDATEVNSVKKEFPTPNNDSTSQQSRKKKKVINNKQNKDLSNLQVEPVAMKIEVGEEDPEDLNNDYGIEGYPDSFADFPNDSLDSPDGNTVGEQKDKIKSSGWRTEARAGSDGEDDTEWKLEIKKKKPTVKRRSKLGQTPIQSKRKKTSSDLSKKVDDSLLKFKCSDCDLGFKAWKNLTEHRQKSHPRKTATLKRLVASIPKAPSIHRKIGHVSVHICTLCGKHVKERSSSKLLTYMEHMLSHDYESNPEETSPHSCTQCDKQFNLKINLDLHEACIHDTRQQVIRCIICPGQKSYRTREALIEHLKSTHGDTVHSCKHCPMSFVSFEKLLFHMMKHRGCKRLVCPECDAVCRTMKELREHCHKVHPQLKETYNCELCDKVYLERSSLRAHMELDHGFERRSNTFKEDFGNANLTCPRCALKGTAKIYKTEFALRMHIQNSHKEQREKFKCDQCDNRYFLSKKSLQNHIETSHEKIRHPCPDCPKTYSDAYSLTQHIKTHSGIGLLFCELCSKGFPRMMQLRSHMRVHDTTEPDPEEKRICEDCGKEFPNQHRLIKHKQNVHPKGTKECPVCGLVVKRSDHLRNHMRIHTGERNFVCPVCNKRFNRRDILRVHVKGVHGMELAEAEEKYKT